MTIYILSRFLTWQVIWPVFLPQNIPVVLLAFTRLRVFYSEARVHSRACHIEKSRWELPFAVNGFGDPKSLQIRWGIHGAKCWRMLVTGQWQTWKTRLSFHANVPVWAAIVKRTGLCSSWYDFENLLFVAQVICFLEALIVGFNVSIISRGDIVSTCVNLVVFPFSMGLSLTLTFDFVIRRLFYCLAFAKLTFDHGVTKFGLSYLIPSTVDLFLCGFSIGNSGPWLLCKPHEGLQVSKYNDYIHQRFLQFISTQQTPHKLMTLNVEEDCPERKYWPNDVNDSNYCVQCENKSRWGDRTFQEVRQNRGKFEPLNFRERNGSVRFAMTVFGSWTNWISREQTCTCTLFGSIYFSSTVCWQTSCVNSARFRDEISGEMVKSDLYNVHVHPSERRYEFCFIYWLRLQLSTGVSTELTYILSGNGCIK